MWGTGNDSEGEDPQRPLRLYQPIPYGSKPDTQDPTATFVGGAIRDVSSSCPTCHDPLMHLAQVHVPAVAAATAAAGSTATLEKTLQVLACNRASCINQLFNNTSEDVGDQGSNNKLSYGGGNGTVFCRRIASSELEARKKAYNESQQTSQSTALEHTAKYNGDDDDDWGADDEGEETMDSLEAQLSKMETTTAATEKSSTTSKTQPNSASKPSSKGGPPVYSLSQNQEPGAIPMEDEDDVGLSYAAGNTANSKDSRKIQDMIARYMAEEEDTEILQALQQQETSGGGGGGKSREKDERLSAEDRAMLTFSDRLKRCPQQVIRYGGRQPLWSIPVVETPTQDEEEDRSKKLPKNQRGKTNNNNKVTTTVMRPIPPCDVCGSPREFEMQILPSLLSTLKVDQQRQKATPAESQSTRLDAAFHQGGMDFGNICIYTCNNTLCTSQQEYVVVQQSLDELPVAFTVNGDAVMPTMGDVLIAEDAKFDDDDSDDDDEDMDDDDDDECS